MIIFSFLTAISILSLACGEPKGHTLGFTDFGEAPPSLIGSWVSACEQVDPKSEIDLSSREATSQFGIDTVRIEITEYSKRGCRQGGQDQKKKSSFLIKANYVLSDASKQADLQAKIDYTFESFFLAFHLDYVTEEMNQISLFGISDWEVDKPREITALQEDPEDPSSRSLPKRGDKIFDRLALRGNQMFFGLDLSQDLDPSGQGTSVEKRPQQVNFERYLSKAEIKGK